MQAADVLAGCVAWVWNCHYSRKSDPDRAALAMLIASLADLYVTAPERTTSRIETILNLGYATTMPFENDSFDLGTAPEQRPQTEMEPPCRSGIEQRRPNLPPFADIKDNIG